MARGGNVPLRYHKDPEKSAATFVEVDGERYSVPGDFAIVEEDGTMTLLGRGSVCINSGGEKIYPEEVEAALKAHPKVFDAVVVGVPDERWGRTCRRGRAAAPGRDADARRARRALPHQGRGLQGAAASSTSSSEMPRHPSGKPDYPASHAGAPKEAPA